MQQYKSIDKDTMDQMYYWLYSGYRKLVQDHVDVLAENEKLRSKIAALEFSIENREI